MIVVGMENAKSNIHSTAIVHPNAKLGKDVIVGPGAVIGEHVEKLATAQKLVQML